MTMIDVPIRLRRAIAANDEALVKRILKNNPSCLTNPDFSNKSNTSLHLAAQYGFLEICEHLIALGHDSTGAFAKDQDKDYYLDSASLGVSHNTDGRTPLHLAATHSHTAVVKLLAARFPECINRQDAEGMTPLMLAARAHPDADYIPPPQAVTNSDRENGASIQATGGAAGLITSRLGPGALALSASKSPSQYALSASAHSQIPSSNAATIDHLLRLPSINSSCPPLLELVSAQDSRGNTALHHASAAGNLKAIRAIVVAGGNPLAKNRSGWTPEAYSVSVQAEVYFKSLINEWKERTAAGQHRRATDADTQWRSRVAPVEGAKRAGSTSPDKFRHGAESLLQVSKTRQRGVQGPDVAPAASNTSLSGMAKGGLRLVMPEDDDEPDQSESDRLRHHNPYPTLSRSQANNRKRGMTDASHSSSTTSGSGSTELSSGSSRNQDDYNDNDNDDDDDAASEQLSDELADTDDETETVRNSIYSPDENDTPPVIHSSPGRIGGTSPGRLDVGYESAERRPLPQFRVDPRGTRPGRPGRSHGSTLNQSDINVVTLNSSDMWK